VRYRRPAKTPPVAPGAGGNAGAPIFTAAGVFLAVAPFLAPALGSGAFISRDTGRMHAPMKHWIASELRLGRLPEWNPYFGLGTPVAANAIDSVQHPFNTLRLLSPQEGLKLWILLCYLLAGWGALWWGRSVGLPWAAAGVTGIAFALSGPLVSSSDNVTYLTSYAALPLAFAGAQRWVDGRGRRWLVSVAGAIALCAAGGDPLGGWALAGRRNRASP